MEIELKKQQNGDLCGISLCGPFRYALFLIFLALVGLEATASPSDNNTGSNELYYIPALPPGAVGFPSSDTDLDVMGGFKNPPPGYGQVPFWWWTGDPLDNHYLTIPTRYRGSLRSGLIGPVSLEFDQPVIPTGK